MNSGKKKIIFVLLISPSFFLNYATLLLLDHNNNLSFFSTIFIFSFNFINIFFSIIYYKYNFKIVFSLLLYCSALFLIFDFALEKVINKKSIVKENKDLGWVLKPNKNINFTQETFKGKKYKVSFKTSAVEGFREYADLNSKNKKILIIGDSYTGGPFASDEEMYYSIIRNILKKNNITFDWFVLAAGGYGTAQQFILLKKHHEIIKPDIILHQFCVNDFFDNSVKISQLSTAHDQYFRRPYIKDGKIFKVENNFSKIYRFLYKYSFIFKKFDQIYNYKQFRNYGRFKKIIPKEFIEESIKNTENLIFEIRKLVGPNTLYFSINCADKKNNYLSPEWEKIINKINGYPLVNPSNQIVKLKEDGLDVNHEDGGHLNIYGNKIYGELIANEMLNIFKNEKYQ